MPKSPWSRGKLLTFLFRWEGWGSVVRPGSAQPPIGPAGPIVYKRQLYVSPLLRSS